MRQITIDKANNGYIVTIGHGHKTLVYETQDALIQALSEHISQAAIDELTTPQQEHYLLGGVPVSPAYAIQEASLNKPPKPSKHYASVSAPAVVNGSSSSGNW